MPAKQRGRGDEKRPPARSRQQPASCSQEDSIGRTQLRPRNLTAQHRQLVPEHDDLEFFELRGSEQKKDEFQDALERDVSRVLWKKENGVTSC